jgi:hypothetical protein
MAPFLINFIFNGVSFLSLQIRDARLNNFKNN